MRFSAWSLRGSCTGIGGVEVRRFLFDKQGKACFYVTGAGVIFDADNTPLGTVWNEQVVGLSGEVLGWFDGRWWLDTSGRVLGFVKGAKADGGLELPQTQPPTFTPQPVAVPQHPLLVPQHRPEVKWEWSEQLVAGLPSTSV